MPAARIHPSTASPAARHAGVAKRRVRRPSSSLNAASASQRSMTIVAYALAGVAAVTAPAS
jgi:hypothetical protein